MRIVEKTDLTVFRETFAQVSDAYGIESPLGPQAKRLPLTDELLRDHLAGTIRIGAYTTDPNGQADQIVVDIDIPKEKASDSEEWERAQASAKSVLHGFDDLGIVAFLTSSKSRGYHVRALWQPGPAAILRRIGEYVAQRAGIQAEVFPKQDRRSEGGLGNFVWLPLHGKSLKNGKTAILNCANGLCPLPDQWEALRDIRRNSPETLAAALAIIEEHENARESAPPKLVMPVGASIPSGHRNNTLASLAGTMRRRGMTQGAIEAALLQENHTKCFPPLPEAEVREIAKSVARYDPAASVLIPEQTLPTEKKIEFPKEVLTGAAGEFARLYSAHLEAPPHFFFMAHLTCLGSVVSDRLTLQSELSPQPRLYTLLLGESADDRKSTAISKTVEFFRAAIDGFRVCWGVGSAEGLQTRMKKENRLLLALDEMRSFVSKCKIEASVLLPCVTTLFESNRYESHTKKSSILLERAHLSILAASTIQTYENTWSSQFTDIGFNNRLWLVPGGAERRFSIPEKASEADRYRVSQKLGQVLEHIDRHQNIEVSSKAKSLYHEWYMQLPRSIYSKRLDTYAIRLMPLLAANNLKDVVDEDTVLKVVSLCEHQLKVRQLHDPIDADNEAAKLEEKIRRVLGARGVLSDRELKRAVHAERKGIWLYETAKSNLQRGGELSFDKKSKRIFLTGVAK